jgi:hypothetical protein
MRSLGFRDGVEWVEVEVNMADLLRGTSIERLEVEARRLGVDVKRHGPCVDHDAMWFQGPRLKKEDA